MRKFRFIGDRDASTDYDNSPNFGEVYPENHHLGRNLSIKDYEGCGFFDAEWEEVFENQSASTLEERIRLVYKLMDELKVTIHDMYEHIR